MYFCVQGHAWMQIPQMVAGISIRPARLVAIARQACASYIDSLSEPLSQFSPSMALAGQRSRHFVQSPHRESSTGLPASTVASVSTVASRTAGPYLCVINSADLPIHPRPARVATVLCGSGVASGQVDGDRDHVFIDRIELCPAGLMVITPSRAL